MAEAKVTVGETDVAGVVLTQRGYVMTVHAMIPTEAELVAATGVAKLALAQSREVGDEEVKTLAALGGELESYLDALR